MQRKMVHMKKRNNLVLDLKMMKKYNMIAFKTLIEETMKTTHDVFDIK